MSINRAGYGGNPIPATKKPVLDTIPLYSALIKKTYEEHSSGKNGIILVGHSLGAATALAIAAFESENLPLLGISALGITPTENHPAGLVDMLKADPENPRLVVEPTPEGRYSKEWFFLPVIFLFYSTFTVHLNISILQLSRR